ncbi:UNVERIFIED_CONTAM: hypothetical protein GTU68_031762 [Idotea baltica]|nr:hypothetical protein [Idotea baltica]
MVLHAATKNRPIYWIILKPSVLLVAPMA